MRELGCFQGVWFVWDRCAFRVVGDRFRLARRVTFSLPVQRESTPDHPGPAYGRTSLLPAPLRGHVTKGRPCPFVPRSASMPRIPLRNASTRPPERDGGAAWMSGSAPEKAFRLCCLLFISAKLGTAPTPPSVGRAESPWKGASGMDGPCTPAPRAAMEGGKSGRRPDPDGGGAILLCLLSSWASKKKVSRRARRNLSPTPGKAYRFNTNTGQTL
ncbi:hypothetical protein FHR87_001306 [Azomonas macrocytogenes]|uniref:Uncharacterized protein n=1 Tax=Azomonas macrocytogenes TaxID=69962 RepID=A0A839T1D3_AZOMA|nr:hypothetical protein [Azomonas macrocytogenes]